MLLKLDHTRRGTRSEICNNGIDREGHCPPPARWSPAEGKFILNVLFRFFEIMFPSNLHLHLPWFVAEKDAVKNYWQNVSCRQERCAPPGKPRGRHNDIPRPTVRKGIRRPLFARSAPGSSRSWVGCWAAPGSSARVSRESRRAASLAATGGGERCDLGVCAVGTARRGGRTSPAAAGDVARERSLADDHGGDRHGREGGGLRVGHGGVLGHRTAAGDVARERGLADGRGGGRGEERPRHGGGPAAAVQGGGRAGRVVHAQVGPAAAARGGGAAVRGGGRGGRGGGWRGRPVWALERSVSLRLGLFERLQKARFVKVVS